MKNNEIIKRTQEKLGRYVTGYKGDIDSEVMTDICDQMWARSKNLGYTFQEWLEEVLKVVGRPNFQRFFDEIVDYKMAKMAAGLYSVFHGERYCA